MPIRGAAIMAQLLITTHPCVHRIVSRRESHPTADIAGISREVADLQSGPRAVYSAELLSHALPWDWASPFVPASRQSRRTF